MEMGGSSRVMGDDDRYWDGWLWMVMGGSGRVMEGVGRFCDGDGRGGSNRSDGGFCKGDRW